MLANTESIRGYRKTILFSLAEEIMSPPRVLRFMDRKEIGGGQGLGVGRMGSYRLMGRVTS